MDDYIILETYLEMNEMLYIFNYFKNQMLLS